MSSAIAPTFGCYLRGYLNKLWSPVLMGNPPVMTRSLGLVLNIYWVARPSLIHTLPLWIGPGAVHLVPNSAPKTSVWSRWPLQHGANTGQTWAVQ